MIIPEVAERTVTNPASPEGQPEGPTAMDSCLLLIPYGPAFSDNPKASLHSKSSDTVILDANLSANRVTINDKTGEELARELGQATFQRNGTTTFYRHLSGGPFTRRGSITQPVISITINSKLLGQDYFSGITASNVKQVYDSLMSQKIIYCSLETFSNSYVRDVDVKQDYIIEPKRYQSQIKQMELSTNERYKIVARGFNSKTNQGYQIGHRREKTEPFLKLYNKSIEVTSNENSVFFEKALHQTCLDNLIRLECTFANVKLLRKYKVLDENESSTVDNVLTGIEQNGLQALNRVLSHYLNPEAGVITVKTKTKGEDTATKLQRKVARIVKLCLADTMPLNETIVEVLGIIEPCANYKALVIRITEAEYEQQLNNAPLPEGLEVFMWRHENR